ncbi:MAG: cytochrome b/b6 domain-containing protein, partial [Chromatiales bacterium]|nr:cytochrome b/b6 domain-containing protein [Chromatiales bacterium]
MSSDTEVKVWDPLVRLFHWSLVAAFTIAYVTEDEWQNLHVWAGYVVAGLLAFRILWGFIGPQYARFSNFIYSPATVIAYLKDMVTLREKRYLGHNPAGGVMVLALLASLALTTLSGMKLYAVEENAGPFANVEINLSPIAVAQADDDDDDEREGRDQGDEFWEEIHEFFANLTLLLVVLHIAGVLFS